MRPVAAISQNRYLCMRGVFTLTISKSHRYIGITCAPKHQCWTQERSERSSILLGHRTWIVGSSVKSEDSSTCTTVVMVVHVIDECGGQPPGIPML